MNKKPIDCLTHDELLKYTKSMVELNCQQQITINNKDKEIIELKYLLNKRKFKNDKLYLKELKYFNENINNENAFEVIPDMINDHLLDIDNLECKLKHSIQFKIDYKNKYDFFREMFVIELSNKLEIHFDICEDDDEEEIYLLEDPFTEEYIKLFEHELIRLLNYRPNKKYKIEQRSHYCHDCGQEHNRFFVISEPIQ